MLQLQYLIVYTITHIPVSVGVLRAYLKYRKMIFLSFEKEQTLVSVHEGLWEM